jgi:tetratricopeptide (TPR) repeat protein
MFFAHWSSKDSSYRDMERRQLDCERCNENTQHTFRYHITKTKHYSVVSIGAGEKTVTLICHGCLLETLIENNTAKELMVEYDKEIAVMESNEQMEQGAFKKAEKKLEKILKNEPQHPQALFSMSKCLISQSKYEEAEIYLKHLESNFPEALDVKDLRKLMP